MSRETVRSSKALSHADVTNPVVWCGVVLCGVVWCGVVCYGVVVMEVVDVAVRVILIQLEKNPK